MKNKNNINKVLEKGKENCCGCYACYNICPVDAITMKVDEKGFYYPIIDDEKCIDCGLCLKVCPTENVEEEIEKDIISYATYNKNQEERNLSSSGGIFSLLAKYTLSKDGIVYGAAYNEKYNVEHKGIEKIENLDSLRRSKYVQSEINEVFKEVKENLNKESLVLFIGTPCHVEALYRFLQKDYENLYTLDFACHGVPSPKVWQIFLNKLEKNNIISLKQDLNINFRNKDDGWKRFNFTIKNNKDEVLYNENAKENPFMMAFLSDLILREACYNCKFKKKYRISDITLSDYWGSQKVEKEIDDDKGLSLVNINSDKGLYLFEQIKKDLFYKETNFDEAVKYNTAWIKSSLKNKNSEKFYFKLEKKELRLLANKYRIKAPLKIRVKRYLKNKIKFIKG